MPDKTLQGHRYFVERFFLENASEMIAKGTRFDSLYDASRIEALWTYHAAVAAFWRSAGMLNR